MARWGRLWNTKLAYRWKMPYANNPNPATSPTCPICTTHEDGAGHILAGCTHATFKGMYIKRHDAAVHLLHKAISKGALGSRRVIMDAGRLEDLPRGVLGKTLPDWLRPPSISAEIWPKLRPGLAILPEVDSPTIAADKEIWILELGYCSDTNHATKAEDKHAQHTQLVAGLRLAGYLVHYLVVTIEHHRIKGLGEGVSTVVLSVNIGNIHLAILHQLLDIVMDDINVLVAREQLTVIGPAQGPQVVTLNGDQVTRQP
eukprot:gene25608-biopygen20096